MISWSDTPPLGDRGQGCILKFSSSLTSWSECMARISILLCYKAQGTRCSANTLVSELLLQEQSQPPRITARYQGLLMDRKTMKSTASVEITIAWYSALFAYVDCSWQVKDLVFSLGSWLGCIDWCSTHGSLFFLGCLASSRKLDAVILHLIPRENNTKRKCASK